MFKNSATQVELKGIRHHRYDTYMEHTYRKKKTKIHKKNSKKKKLPCEGYICMHGIRDKHVSELEKHILLSHECRK